MHVHLKQNNQARLRALQGDASGCGALRACGVELLCNPDGGGHLSACDNMDIMHRAISGAVASVVSTGRGAGRGVRGRGGRGSLVGVPGLGCGTGLCWPTVSGRGIGLGGGHGLGKGSPCMAGMAATCSKVSRVMLCV